MSLQSRPSTLVLGLALFSMFFGSGNLIYPLSIGVEAQQLWWVALAGFACTAVFLPLMGVFAMVLYEGNSRSFFDLLGKKPGFLFASLLLLVWIPLGSGPRCIALSYASISVNLIDLPSWLYGALYSALIGALVWRRRRAINILGSVLTPMLLFCLGAIFVSTFFFPRGWSTSSTSAPSTFIHALVEGYNTQDLIASFFFSASVLAILARYEEASSMRSNLLSLLKAGVIAAAILAIVYAMLMYSAAVHSSLIEGMPREKMLATLAKAAMGPQLGVLASLAVLLACVTTSVALAVVYTDYLVDEILPACSYSSSLGLLFTLLISYLMSLTGLEGITIVTSPILQFCYPLLLLIILYAMAKKLLASK